MEDIFAYAYRRVRNKGFLTRLLHSPKFHFFRSAVAGKGSAASKFGSLAGAAARVTLGCIPVPVVGGLLAAAESKLERVARTWHHRRRKDAVTATTADKVKFTLKELSVEELDRYRWKVANAISDFNSKAPQFATNLVKTGNEHRTCEAYLEMAKAIEEVDRRIEILKEACLTIITTMQLTMNWIEECENGVVTGSSGAAAVTATRGVTASKNSLRETIREHIQQQLDTFNGMPAEEAEAYVVYHHGKCNEWCCFRDQGQIDNWINFKDNAGKALKFVSDPFVPDSFGNNVGSLWKTD